MSQPVLMRCVKYYWLGNMSVVHHLKRHMAVVGNPTVDKALTTITGGRIDSWLLKYEELVGLREVKEAQHKVIEVFCSYTFILFVFLCLTYHCSSIYSDVCCACCIVIFEKFYLHYRNLLLLLILLFIIHS